MDIADTGAPARPDADQLGLLGLLSTEALRLHLCATLVSADSRRVGFVPDTFLDCVDEDLRLPIAELTITDRWRREQRGFQIPPEELRRVIDTLRLMAQEW